LPVNTSPSSARRFGFVQLNRPTLTELQTKGFKTGGGESFLEDWQTIDKRKLTLYPRSWQGSEPMVEQLGFFSTPAQEFPYEFIFSLQDQALVRFISDGLNRIMTPARFLISARNSPVPTAITMELVAMGTRMVPRLDLDMENLTRPKKVPYRKENRWA
jgi:hypothetical protein